jgi:hypothetical protein
MGLSISHVVQVGNDGRLAKDAMNAVSEHDISGRISRACDA